MALQVGELFSKLEIRTGGAEKALSDHHRAMQQAEQQAARTERAVGSVGQVIQGAGNQARGASSQFSTMGRGVEQAGRQAGTTGNVFQRMGQMVASTVGRALSLGNAMRGVGQVAGTMARAVTGGGRSLEDMGRSAGQTEGALSRVGSMMSNVISTAMGFIVAQGIMRAFSAATSFVKDAFIGMNDLLEQSSIAFTTMLGSAQASEKFLSDLADFAARTPFDFPGLLTAAQRMMAYGFSAQEVLPLLEDVGNASAALGAGAAGVDRMTLALGQMAAKGRVQTQELLQLTELGIPAFQLLADAVGVSVGEIQEMVSAGEVSSDVFLRIFHEWAQANFGDMMEKQSRTFTGAMSNITDVMQMGIARGLEPFFNAFRDGAIRVAEFLETDRFNQWVSTLQQVSQAAVDAILSIPGTARAIHGWVDEIISSGNPLTAFLDSLPGWFKEAVDRIGGILDIGGYNAVTAFAQGMMDSAQRNVQAAVDYITNLIASHLVGQSPPPEGPLSEIDQAGKRLMETYTDGMADGVAGAVEAADSVAQAFDEIDEQMQLDAGRAGLEAATGNLEEMEAVSADVEQKIGDIDAALRDIDSQLLAIDRDIADINEKYDEQLEPLQEQLDLLEKQRDLQAEKLQLEHDLQRARVEQARLEALGDPERRAEIAGQLELNEIQQERLANEEELAKKRAELEGGGKELTAEERERLELRERELEIQHKETKQRLDNEKDLTALEKEKLQLKLDQIDADLRANRAKQDAKPEELTEAERKQLEYEIEELELRQELLDMLDAEKAAQAEADGQLLDSRQKERDLLENIADIQNDIAKIPILEEIEAIEAARREELEPLERQREAYQEQREDLDYIRKQWQFLKGDVDAALEPLREAARLQEQMAKDAERQAKELERAASAVAKRPDNSFEASQARLRGEDSCPPGWVMDAHGRCFNPEEEAWKQGIKDAEAAAKADGGGSATEGMPGWSDLFGGEKQDVEVPVTFVPEVDDVLSADMIQPKQASIWEGFGAAAAMGFVNRLGEVIQENIGRVMGASIGAAIGGGIGSLVPGLGPAGAAIGGLLGGLIGDGVQERLEENPIDFGGFVERIQGAFDEHVRPVFDRFHEWLVGGQENVRSFSETVSGFFNSWIAPALQRISNDLLPVFQDAWARIEPTIEPAIRNVARMFEWIARQINIHGGTIRRIVDAAWSAVAWLITFYTERWSEIISGVLAVIGGDWETGWKSVRDFASGVWNGIGTIVSTGIRLVQKFIEDALPVIWSKLKEWGAAFWDWVEPQIGPMLEELGKLLYQLGEWIVTDALPAIAEKLWEWGKAFFEWVVPLIPPLLEELTHISDTLWQWIGGTAAPAIVERLKTWGAAFLDWVANDVIPFIVEKLGQISTALLAWITDTALPWIVERLKGWGAAFLDWVHEQVLGEDGLVSKLGDVASAILGWIGDKTTGAAKSIWEKMGEFAAAFIGWVTDTVLGTGEGSLVGKLADVLQAIIGWATDTENLRKAGDAVKSIGEAIVEGIWEGIKGLGSWFKDKVGGWIKEHVPDFIYKEVDGGSPARVMIPIGESVVQGLIVGLAQQEHALNSQLASMVDRMVAGARQGVVIPRISSQMALPAAGQRSLSGALAQLSAGGREIVIHNHTHQTLELDGEVIDRRTITTINRHAGKTY